MTVDLYELAFRGEPGGVWGLLPAPTEAVASHSSTGGTSVPLIVPLLLHHVLSQESQQPGASQCHGSEGHPEPGAEKLSPCWISRPARFWGWSHLE